MNNIINLQSVWTEELKEKVDAYTKLVGLNVHAIHIFVKGTFTNKKGMIEDLENNWCEVDAASIGQEYLRIRFNERWNEIKSHALDGLMICEK